MAKGTADSGLVKKPYEKIDYTQQQLIEFQKCADRTDGPLYFMENFMRIQHPTKGAIAFKPFDYQIELIRNYNEYVRSVNLLGRQMGKALSLDTPIMTPTGFTTVGDIKVGDVIYGRNGKPTTVTYITDVMNDRPCYEINFKHGETIIADEEHLWNIVLPKQEDEVTITTKELIQHFNKLKTSSQSLHIRCAEMIEYEHKNVPIDPYYLGLWLGDGGSSDLRITSTIDDYDEYVEILSKRGLEVSKFTLDKRSNTTGTFYVKGGASKFKELNLWGNKHIPDLYIYNSAEVRILLLQGLMDSDGTCEKTGVSRFYQSNEILIDQVRLLLSTLGIKTTKGVKETTHKDAYTLCFSEKEIPLFALERKFKRQRKLKNHKKNKRIYINSIQQVDSVPVRCLQVDNEDHMFLCGKTMIPTHNTTVAAGYLLWYAMFVPDSTILVAAHKASGSNEIMQRVRYAYENVPDHIRAGAVEYNKGSLTFDNGSRIVATTTTETTGRGMSLSLVYLDEFAFVRPTIAKEFWTSLSPTLATGGKAIVTSTPNNDDDTFATIWRGALNTFDEYGNENPAGIGTNGFKGYIATWDQHPDRDEVWAAQERASIGEERFCREHSCEFIIFEETLINALKLAELEPVDPMRQMGQVRWYKYPHPERSYVVSLDPSAGTGGDPAAIQVIELPTMEQVAEWQHNKTPIEGQMKCMMSILQYLKEMSVRDIYWSVENNSIGEAALVVIRDTGEESFPGEFISEPRKVAGAGSRKGFYTGHKTKLAACITLKRLIESNKLTIRSKPLIKELKNFVARGNSFAAKPGEHDDLVMSLILNVRMIEYISTFEDDVYDAVNSNLVNLLDDDPDDWDGPLPLSFL